VVRTHELVADLAGKGYEVVYIGRKGHPEPEGVMGEAPGRVHLVQDPQDIEALELHGDRIAVTCQTTLSVWDTEDLIGKVQARYPHAEVYNEICRATQERQEAAVEAAKEVDLVIVVGSPRSSNSLRLVEVVKKLGHKPAYLVDNLDELNVEWFKGARKVGVHERRLDPDPAHRRVIEYLEAWRSRPNPRSRGGGAERRPGLGGRSGSRRRWSMVQARRSQPAERLSRGRARHGARALPRAQPSLTAGGAACAWPARMHVPAWRPPRAGRDRRRLGFGAAPVGPPPERAGAGVHAVRRWWPAPQPTGWSSERG
jgi:hypothetical protein